MRFIQTGRTGSDETAPYDVIDIDGMTVGEFIDKVLVERNNEWGDFTIRQMDGFTYPWLGSHRSEYKYGKLLEPIEERIRKRKIISVKASGGWTNMDYIINMK